MQMHLIMQLKYNNGMSNYIQININRTIFQNLFDVIFNILEV